MKKVTGYWADGTSIEYTHVRPDNAADCEAWLLAHGAIMVVGEPA